MPLSPLLLATVLANPQAGFETFAIQGSVTDPGITQAEPKHRVFVPSKNRRNRLLVFLPGTGGDPARTSLFQETAAEAGYDVVGLMYPNAVAAVVVSSNPDKDAFRKFRMQIIEGGNHWPNLKVDRANSIENRLEKLVAYLAKTRSHETWKSYLAKDGRIKWDKTVLVGHSQGAGHAGLMAINHKVERVIMFGGPKDWDRVRNAPAAWYTKPATPIGRFFSFNHKLDLQGCDYEQQVLNCRAFGMEALGKPAFVEKSKPPYGKSRILFTDYDLGTTASVQCHTSVSSNQSTPKENGVPVFKPVWLYMLTAPTG